MKAPAEGARKEACTSMPRYANRIGAAGMVLPIEQIAPTLARPVERDHDGLTEKARQ